MPQMSPMMWFWLNLIFLMMFYLSLLKINFFFTQKISNKNMLMNKKLYSIKW